jgi:hypothetical protein
MPIIKVISGGQTGVDRAALDAALHIKAVYPMPFFSSRLGTDALQVGGYCPLDRTAEDGVIPDRYPLTPVASPDYNVRTYRNVHASDATLIVTTIAPSGGTAKTIQFCRELHKPYLVVDPSAGASAAQEHTFQDWIESNEIKVLNIAGPRQSKCPGIYDAARALLERLLLIACGIHDL